MADLFTTWLHEFHIRQGMLSNTHIRPYCVFNWSMTLMTFYGNCCLIHLLFWLFLLAHAIVNVQYIRKTKGLTIWYIWGDTLSFCSHDIFSLITIDQRFFFCMLVHNAQGFLLFTFALCYIIILIANRARIYNLKKAWGIAWMFSNRKMIPPPFRISNDWFLIIWVTSQHEQWYKAILTIQNQLLVQDWDNYKLILNGHTHYISWLVPP